MKRILIVGIILLLLVVGCGKKETTAPDESTLPPPLTAAEIIARASEELEALSSFHFALDQEGGGTPIAMGLEMTAASGDIVRPAKLKVKVFASYVAGYVEAEVITVGEVTFMTHPLTGEWEPLPNEFTAVRLFNPDTGIKAIIEKITNAVILGEEKVAGVLCYHIKGTLDSGDLSAITCGNAIEGVSIDTEVWIGKEDFLLRQIKLEGQITKDEEPGIVRTLSLSNFDQPITIELPE